MRDFQEFIDKNIAVVFKNKNEQIDFLKLCNEHELKWYGRDASDIISVADSYCAIAYKAIESNSIGYSNRSYYERKEFEIVEASEFLSKEKDFCIECDNYNDGKFDSACDYCSDFPTAKNNEKNLKIDTSKLSFKVEFEPDMEAFREFLIKSFKISH